MDQEQTPQARAQELVRLLMPDWRPNPQQILWAIRIAIVVTVILFAVLLILYIIGLLFGVTVWDLLKVLAVPITIGAAVPLLNWLQRKRELHVENQRAQDAALEAYEDKMDRLILDKNLRASEQGSDDVRDVARMHTLSVLRRLDPNRKRHVVQFLWDGKLIKYETKEDGWEVPPIISLRRADLTDANLARMPLVMTNLSGAQLVAADLSNASLSSMMFDSAAIDAMSEEVDLKDVAQPAAVSTLRAANLTGADLRGTQLLGVDLTWPILSGADLSGATVTQEQLDRAKSLEGVTMPNGQKYEDWLKSREEGGEG